MLAITTYGLIDRYLLRQRERTAQLQTFLNARAFRDALNLAPDDVPAALQDLELPPGTSVVVHDDGTWYGTSVAVGRDAIPENLRAVVVPDGDVASARTSIAGTTAFALGIPIAGTDAEYFEVTLFDELDKSLAIVRNSLIGAAALTTIGAALLGVWAGRRVLRPLADVSAAASDIATGRLDRRLDDPDDPDLAPLMHSFNEMVDALQSRIERDRRFAGDVSHELRSPLTTLAAAAGVLERRRDELPERVREPVDLLMAEIARFQRLVVELLELSRAQQGLSGAALTPVVVADVVRGAAVDAGCDLSVLAVEHDVLDRAFVTDRLRVARVAANLLDNAMTHGGGVSRIGLELTDDGFRICVDDHGPGVPDAERARIFEPFFRGSAAGRRGDGSGTGLGLALVAEHVAALRGRVWVEGAPAGTGARFVVELPGRSR